MGSVPQKPIGIARARELAMRPAFVKAAAAGWSPVATIDVGGFSLSHLGGGVYWLENAAGEGMATKRENLEAMLRKFWEQEF